MSVKECAEYDQQGDAGPSRDWRGEMGFDASKEVDPYEAGYAQAIEDAARACEDVITFSEDHIDFAPDDATIPCGFCISLERAAAKIRSLIPQGEGK